MTENQASSLRARYRDLMARYQTLQRMGYVASAAALLQQAWRVEDRLIAAGWLL